MTRGKPTILSRKTHDRTRAERKEQSEGVFQSGGLPMSPPVELRGMKAAQRAWRRLMKANSQLPADLFNALDRGFMINYCQAVESQAKALELEGECHQSYIEGQFELEDLLKARVELRMATRLVADLSRQLYCSPKSRAGVNPETRTLTPEELISQELEELDL
jgi:phage terminase small subunit